MHSNNKKNRQQQEEISKRIKKVQGSDNFSFSNILSSPEISSVIEPFMSEYRQRVYSPTTTLSLFLTQALNEDRSCQKVVSDFVIERIENGLPLISSATGAYTQARQRLPLSMIEALAWKTAELIELETPTEWLWMNKHVYLIDGTTVTMPDTEDNQENYPQPNTQKEGIGFPLCRMVGVISLASGALINVKSGPYSGKETGEQSLLRQLLPGFNKGEVILGDAIYGTYFIIATLMASGIDFVFEQMGGRKTDFRTGQKLGIKDHLVTLKKPNKKPDWMTQEDFDLAPSDIIIRELNTGGRGGKTLITSFLSPKEISRNDLQLFYRDRWHVEVDIRNIKTTMGMDVLSCKTSEMINKEMLIYFLAYNIIRLLMAQSASLNNILPRQLSFKHTLQLWLAWSIRRVSMDNDSLELLFSLIAQKRVGNRPGRMEPRAVKRRPKSFARLSIPRSAARDEIIKNGHSEKLTH